MYCWQLEESVINNIGKVKSCCLISPFKKQQGAILNAKENTFINGLFTIFTALYSTFLFSFCYNFQIKEIIQLKQKCNSKYF